METVNGHEVMHLHGGGEARLMGCDSDIARIVDISMGIMGEYNLIHLHCGGERPSP
jgi:hypothetical protein